MSDVPVRLLDSVVALESAFSDFDGTTKTRFRKLEHAEASVILDMPKKADRFLIISRACIDFMLECVESLSNPNYFYNVTRMCLFVSSITRLRSCYLLMITGYYFDAGALLRGVFESALHLAADAHGWEPLSTWFGDGSFANEPSDSARQRFLHRNAQRRNKSVEDKMYKTESGLSEEDQQHLKTILFIMHSHVHKSEMHFVKLIVDVNESKRAASVYPMYNAYDMAAAAGSYFLTVWMMCRLLAHAMPEAERTSKWRLRWGALDDCLNCWFTCDSSKSRHAAARFVQAKFVFAGQWASEPATSTVN